MEVISDLRNEGCMEWEEGRCTYCMKQKVSKRIETALHYKRCLQQTLMLRPIASNMAMLVVVAGQLVDICRYIYKYSHTILPHHLITTCLYFTHLPNPSNKPSSSPILTLTPPFTISTILSFITHPTTVSLALLTKYPLIYSISVSLPP